MRASASLIVALLITSCTEPTNRRDDPEDFEGAFEFPDAPPGAVHRLGPEAVRHDDLAR